MASPSIQSALLADGELHRAEGRRVEVTDERLTVELADGRIISTPLKWYPRLVHATSKERKNVRLDEVGMHWPDLDEDINYRGLLLGRRDRSNRRFLRFWLENKKKGEFVTFEDWMKRRRKSSPPKKTARKGS